MIGTSTLVGIVVQIALSILFPVALWIYFRRKESITWRPILVGALVFLVFSQILEKALHVFVLIGNPTTAKWMQSPLPYAVYGALAAGIFEEAGRYIGFRWMLRNSRERRDGLALGLGHGGFESLLIGATAGVQSLVFALAIRNGQWEQLTAGLPAGTAEALHQQLTTTAPWMFAVAGIERALALLLQIGFSLLVLMSVRTGRMRYWWYAIGFHTAVDFFAALYQKQAMPLAVVEVVLLVSAAVSVWIIRSSRMWMGVSRST